MISFERLRRRLGSASDYADVLPAKQVVNQEVFTPVPVAVTAPTATQTATAATFPAWTPSVTPGSLPYAAGPQIDTEPTRLPTTIFIPVTTERKISPWWLLVVTAMVGGTGYAVYKLKK